MYFDSNWSITHTLKLDAVGLIPTTIDADRMVDVNPCDNSVSYKGARRRFHGLTQIPAVELKKFDLLAHGRCKIVRDKDTVVMPGGPRSKIVESPVDSLFCAVLGLYLAEGYLRPDGRTVQFTFHVNELHHLEIVEEWCAAVGLNVHNVESNRSTRQVYVYRTAFSMWLRANLRSGSWFKDIPYWIQFLPHEKQIELLKYYFHGDGCVDIYSSSIAAATRSMTIARPIQSMMARLGYPCCLHIGQDHGKPIYRMSVNGVHGQKFADRIGYELPNVVQRYSHIRMDDDYVYYPVRSVETSLYAWTVRH